MDSGIGTVPPAAYGVLALLLATSTSGGPSLVSGNTTDASNERRGIHAAAPHPREREGRGGDNGLKEGTKAVSTKQSTGDSLWMVIKKV